MTVWIQIYVKVAKRFSYQESTSEGLVDTSAIYLLEEVHIFHFQVVAKCDHAR
jgi:hypothetical protein